MIKLPDWVKHYLRKQPKNMTGQYTFTFQDGHLQHIERRDRVSEKSFYDRYAEHTPTPQGGCTAEGARDPEKGHANGHTAVNGGPVERPAAD